MGPRTGFYAIPASNPGFLVTNGISGIYGTNPAGSRPAQNVEKILLRDPKNAILPTSI